MIDLALYSHAVSSFTQALYLRYFPEEPGHFPFQGGPIFLLGHRKLAEVCGDPFACPPLGRHISCRMPPRPLSMVELNTPRDSTPITSPQETIWPGPSFWAAVSGFSALKQRALQIESGKILQTPRSPGSAGCFCG